MATRTAPARQARMKFQQGDFDVSALLKPKAKAKPFHETDHGALFSGDCMEMLGALRD